jgi:GAF domain-containing protein
VSDPAERPDPFKPFLDVAAALLSSPLLDEALQNVARAIGEAMNVATVDIQSYHREAGCLIEEAAWNRDGLTDADRAYMGARIDLATRPTFTPILERGEMVEFHIDDPDLAPEERAVFETWGYKTTLDAPLMIGESVIGVLGITETRFVRRFMSMELERFAKLCGMAAAAMHNAQLMARQQDYGRRLDLLLEMSTALATGGGGEAAAVAARGCRDLLGASAVSVHGLTPVADTDGLGRRLAAATAEGSTVVDPSAVAAALLDRALHSCGAVTATIPAAATPESAEHTDDPTMSALSSAGGRTHLAVVATHGGVPQALLSVSWPDERRLTHGELRLFEALAAQLALALENDALVEPTS